MIFKFKGTGWNTIFYLILGFLPLSVNFILAPIFTSVFETSEYGLLGLAGFFTHLFTVIIALGLQGSVNRFYFYYSGNDKLKNTLFSTVIILVLFIFCCFLIVFAIIGDSVFNIIVENHEFTYNKYGFWVYINSFSTILNVVILSYYRNEARLRPFALVSISFFFFSLIGNLVGVFIYDLGAYGSIVGRAIGAGLATFPFMILFLQKGQFIIRRRLIKPLIKYAAPLIPYGFLMMLYESVDKIMVERLFGLDALGSYTFAYQVSGIISVFLFAIFNAISPLVNKELSLKHVDEVKVSNILNGFIFVSYSFIALFIAIANPLIYHFIDSDYHNVTQFIAILFLSYIGRSLYMTFSLFLFFYHKNSSLNYITIIAVIVGVSTAILFSNWIGIMAIYLAVLLMKFSQAIGAFLFTSKMKLGLFKSINFSKILHLSVLLIVGTFIPIFFKSDNTAFLFNLIPISLLCLYAIWNRKYFVQIMNFNNTNG